jgi:hypothetical protein
MGVNPLGSIQQPDGRAVQIGASHRISAFDVAKRDVTRVAKETSDALAARSVLHPAARVIMVYVDELALLKWLEAHATGVMLGVQ